MAGPPFIPKNFEQLEDFVIEFNNRLSNLEGVEGKGLSHDNLADTEDHDQFLRADGSVPMTGPLNMAGQQIQDAANDIMKTDVRAGEIRVDKGTNTLTLDPASNSASTADSKAVSAAGLASSLALSNSTNISSNTSAVASNSTNISSNTSAVASNSVNISKNESRLTAGGH